jgi:hypothetical protein
MRKATPTLARLQIRQGYLLPARTTIDALRRRGLDPAVQAELEDLWAAAATVVRRKATLETLRGLLARVRAARAGGSGWAP